MLTQDFLRTILHYDPDTGIFTWIDSRNHRMKIGTVAGTIGTDGYCRIRVSGKKQKAHRLIWLYVYGRWPTDAIDHINMNKSDNRLCNLREAVSQQNCRNRGLRSDSRTGFKGVSIHPRQPLRPYLARLCIEKGKRVTLGSYDTPEKAYAAYCSAALQHFGPFANLGQQTEKAARTGAK